MKQCKICVASQNDKEDVIVAGNVYLQDGKLSLDIVPGYEILMSGISEEFPKENTEKWFNDLPNKYHGSYMWADKIIEKK